MTTTSAASATFPDLRKFQDPAVTADGQARAHVALRQLDTLWFCTGTLCNLACRNCYIESSPRNDSLVYISADEVADYFDEIERDSLGTQSVGFTGGEPFMNPDMIPILADSLTRGYKTLVLTNAMRPMMKRADELLDLHRRFGNQLTVRVSIDHYTQALHEAERGPKSWEPAVRGLHWLTSHGFEVDIAGRLFTDETEQQMRDGYAAFFQREGIDLDAHNRNKLALFPEMDTNANVPEITEACWTKLGVSPDDQMCASSRMVIKRKGEDRPVVLPCTLLPHDDPQFQLGHTLAESFQSVALNHPHCATFCVLGGASCGG